MQREQVPGPQEGAERGRVVAGVAFVMMGLELGGVALVVVDDGGGGDACAFSGEDHIWCYSEMFQAVTNSTLSTMDEMQDQKGMSSSPGRFLLGRTV